jgi:hypothetical protein
MGNDNDWMEMLLRAQRAEPVADDGFSKRLTSRLPRHRQLRWRPVPVLTSIGFVLAAPSVLNSRTLADLTAMMSSYGLLTVGLVAVGLTWVSCAWAIVASNRRVV